MFASPDVSYSIDDAKEPGKSEEGEKKKINYEYCGALVNAELNECPHCVAVEINYK